MSSPAFNQMLTAHIMSKIIFTKYLPPIRSKLFPKLKCSGFIDIWHMLYFRYAKLDCNVKNTFYEIFTTCSAQIGSKLNMLKNY